MLRNKELQGIILLGVLFVLVGTILGTLVDYRAAVLVFVCTGAVFAVFFAYTLRRYRAIKRLSEYLSSVYMGEQVMDIRDNREGELSILKNDLYKVTLTLSEQSELLKKDKQYLADTLSNISHQLKTPLTSMFVMTDLLNKPDLPQGKKEEFLKNITNQLKRIEWLVSSLLKLSKIDAKTVVFKKEEVPVAQLIQRALEPICIPIELKGLTLTVGCEQNIAVVTDMNWTTEALLNVLKNCMEHTLEGGRIDISCRSTPLHTELMIKDSGAGIAAEDILYVFDRFYKGKNAGADSVGIGLAMAKTILTSQNADISVQSEPGKGARFIIKFFK